MGFELIDPQLDPHSYCGFGRISMDEIGRAESFRALSKSHFLDVDGRHWVWRKRTPLPPEIPLLEFRFDIKMIRRRSASPMRDP